MLHKPLFSCLPFIPTLTRVHTSCIRTSTIFKMTGRGKIAVSFETGVQNTSVVLAALALSYKGCERSIALAFPLCISFWCKCMLLF